MLTSVEMTSIAVPRTFTIGGVDPDDTIILKSVSGLTPSDVNLFTGDFAGNGGYYQGRRFGGRNIVFTFKLNPDYSTTGPRSVSSLRRELYDMFYQPTYYQDNLTVFFDDDEIGTVVAQVYADKYQGDIFTQDTTVQISTQCVDSFLNGAHVQYDAPAGGVLSIPVTYAGNARVGLRIGLVANVDGTDWQIHYFGQTMKWHGSYSAGDTFGISTVDGEQYITKLHYVPLTGYIQTNELGGLSADSDWIEQSKGTSTLSVYGTAAGDGKLAIMSYSYDTKWLGI